MVRDWFESTVKRTRLDAEIGHPNYVQPPNCSTNCIKRLIMLRFQNNHFGVPKYCISIIKYENSGWFIWLYCSSIIQYWNSCWVINTCWRQTDDKWQTIPIFLSANWHQVITAFLSDMAFKIPFLPLVQIEGFRPEWYISSMIHSQYKPFWSETLEMWLLNMSPYLFSFCSFRERGCALTRTGQLPRS